MKNLFELPFGAATLLSMKAPIKKIKRKRDPDMSFGELVQRLWQPESEEPEPKAAGRRKNSQPEHPREFGRRSAGAEAMRGGRGYVWYS
jgi:hypothetical protein